MESITIILNIVNVAGTLRRVSFRLIASLQPAFFTGRQTYKGFLGGGWSQWISSDLMAERPLQIQCEC